MWLISIRPVFLLLCKPILLCVQQQCVLHMSFAWDPRQYFNQLARHWEHGVWEWCQSSWHSGLDFALFSTHSPLQVDIVIDIQPAREGPEVVRDLILILKCKKDVNWVIKSFDVKGSLKVIVSWPRISWSC